MRRIFILLLLALHVSASVTIEDAWRQMQEKSPALQSLSIEKARAGKLQDAASAMYLPKVSLSGSYTHLDKPVELDISDASKVLGSLPIPIEIPSAIDLSEQDVFLAHLDMLWPLYTGGKIGAAQDIYRSKSDEVSAKAMMQRDKAFVRLVKVYYGVVVAKALYETRQKAQKALELHLEHAQKLKEQGQIAQVELLSVQVKRDEAKIETTKAKHKLEIAESALHVMLHAKQNPSSHLFIEAQADSEAFYTQESLDNFAGLSILHAKGEQVDALIDIEEASYLPTVFAYGNYMLYKDDSIAMEMIPQWFAGLGVKIDLFSRDGRSEKIDAAKLLKRQLDLTQEQAREDLSLLVEKTYNEMLLYQDEYNSLNSSLHLAKENVKLRQIAFREGLSTSLELVDAELFLMASQTKRLNVAYHYVQAIAQLAVLSGDRERFFQSANLAREVK